MPGIECKFRSLSAKIKLKQIKILTSCHCSASKNPKDLLAGLLFFFFSSNRRSAVLKLYKSWYETLFFADRAVIAAIFDILLFRSVIRYTADNCQRARNVLDFQRQLSLDAPGTGWKSVGVDPLVVWSLATLAAGNSLEFLGEICTPGRLLWPRTRLLARSQEQSFELVFSKAKHWKFAEVIKVYLRKSCSSLIVVILVHRAG